MLKIVFKGFEKRPWCFRKKTVVFLEKDRGVSEKRPWCF